MTEYDRSEILVSDDYPRCCGYCLLDNDYKRKGGMIMIDIDKFICSMAERKVLNPIIIGCLKDQGLMYKDGEIHYICEEEPKEKKLRISDVYVDEDEFKNKVKELIHSGESAYLDDSFWGKEEVEKLMKETNEGSKKIMEQMRKIVFAKEPDFDAMALKYQQSHRCSNAERRSYTQGLLDMWNKIKKG